MHDFVRKQLHHIGYNDDKDKDIYLGFKDINELEFRGLTTKIIRELIPNRGSDVVMEIIHHVEVLRANAAHAANQNQLQSHVSSSSGNQTDDPIKPEPVNYSSGSDIEVLSDEEEESVVTTVTVVNNDNDSDGSIIEESVPRRSRRPIKRAHLINLNEAASSTIGPKKVSRTEDGNNDVDEENVSEVNPGGSLDAGPENSEIGDSTTRLRVRKCTRVETLSNPGPGPSVTNKPKKKKNPDDKPSVRAFTVVNDDFIESLENTLQAEQKLPTKRNYKIDHSLEENDLSMFYDNLGKYIQCLELEYWSWNHDNSIDCSKKEDWWTKDLKKILYVFCPKLEVLTLRANSTIRSGKTEINKQERIRLLPKLQEVNVTDCSSKVLSQLEIIFKAARLMQRFQFIFGSVKYVTRILTLIEKLSQDGFLNELTELSILTEGEKKLSLCSSEFLTLSRCNLPKLQYLEIGCGLADVSKESFEAMLNKFSTSLEVFNCRGTFCGNHFNYFTIVVPKMDNLRYFSLGADYEFDSTSHTERTLNLDRVAQEAEGGPSRVYNVREEKDFINFGLQMCNLYPSMETIRIGNMCTLEDLHFFNFPKLETFHVGGPWDRMIKFPSPTSRNPNYPKIEAIKIPDSIMNESLILEISRVFPNVTKVTMWLPSAQCLKKFFKTMVNSKLRELHLKTNFCFSWTLTEILIGKNNAGARPPSELAMIEELVNYFEYKEYIRFHNIDFPFDTLEPTDPDFEPDEEIADVDKKIEFFNRQLKIFEVEHVGRLLEVPKGDFSFKDSRCEFHAQKIGFPCNYPLTTRNFMNGFTVTREDEGEAIRKYKIKNISMPRVESQNFHHTPTCRRDSCTCSVSSASASSNTATFGRAASDFKVKIKPTPVVMQKTERVKNENR